MPAEVLGAKEKDDSRQTVSGLDELERVPVSDTRWGRFGSRLWAGTWPKVLALVLVIGAWQALFVSGWKDPWVLPSPLTVWEDLSSYMATPDYWQAIGITLQRAVTGFALSVAVGSALGIAVARFKPLRAAIGSLITGLQTMPSIIWFPLAILLFQISESTIMFVVVLGAVPSIANGIISGIDYVPPAWKRVGAVLGMRGLTLYRHVILPATLPSFVSGLKQGWAFAWRSLMAGELLVIVAGQGSIGALMQGAREFSDSARVLTWIITVLVIGILVDALFRAADNRIRESWGLNQDR
ncbi:MULTISPECIES: ABC transporter permease [Glycomyces]|uniref:ABC transporter permease n=2 Tax=Glycomyces TaxID=58113 RepID=A0A9X3SWG5_9ACTN|nr:ABC transporter permease [Glycomyces lechevalierae]MDA1384046.1 ABC transporter permease [Glycomyces lechevalierae]MDR7340959.1 NitT/TauT family transport system permease protein [Glycomyces lechevalierae]